MRLNFIEFLETFRIMFNIKVLNDRQHLRLAGEWFLKAQKEGKGGYAHSFSLMKGWLPGYPETTGYIIPSMLDLGKKLNERRFIDSAQQAGDWLLSKQNQDGSFSDISGERQVFDTGQIIYGFLALNELDANQKYLDSMNKAVNWLINMQELNGSWVKFAYHNRAHSYYSRVGAILVKLGDVWNNQKIKDAGIKNINWVLGNQLSNGFFEQMSFTDEQPYLHTIIYTLEGLLECRSVLHDQNLLSKVVLSANKLIEVSGRDGILRSQYGRNWEIANGEKCITGLAQWSLVCFKLGELLQNKEYLTEAMKNLEYLKRKQVICSDINCKGALSGSVPIWGKYGRFAFPNWGVKYFIDALLKSMAIL